MVDTFHPRSRTQIGTNLGECPSAFRYVVFQMMGVREIDWETDTSRCEVRKPYGRALPGSFVDVRKKFEGYTDGDVPVETIQRFRLSEMGHARFIVIVLFSRFDSIHPCRPMVASWSPSRG